MKPYPLIRRKNKFYHFMNSSLQLCTCLMRNTFGYTVKADKINQIAVQDFLLCQWWKAGPEQLSESVAALVSWYCFIIVPAVIVLGLGALFLLFGLLFSQRRISSHSCGTFRELLQDPIYDRHPQDQLSWCQRFSFFLLVAHIC